ncbi:MAG: hypothetical protein IAF58_21180 [Leptolyngbya sp.]|nr:hypothetical protein [Candidatus Melainabacteria bacterium]
MNNDMSKRISLLALSSGLMITPCIAENLKKNSETSPSKINIEKTNCVTLDSKYAAVQSLLMNSNKTKLKEAELYLNKAIQEIENSPEPTATELKKCSDYLFALAQYHAPSTLSSTKYFSSNAEEEFKIAKEYMNRSLKLKERATKDTLDLVRAHRDALGWYAHRNRKNEVREQTEILSKMLNSTDPDVIDPPRHYSACGKGIDGRESMGNMYSYDCGRG